MKTRQETVIEMDTDYVEEARDFTDRVTDFLCDERCKRLYSFDIGDKEAWGRSEDGGDVVEYYVINVQSDRGSFYIALLKA